MVQVPREARYFLFSKASSHLLGPPFRLFSGYMGSAFCGEKSGHWPPSSVEVKLRRTILPLCHAYLRGMQRGQCLLPFLRIHEALNGKLIFGDERCYVVMAYWKGTTAPFFWSDRRVI